MSEQMLVQNEAVEEAEGVAVLEQEALQAPDYSELSAPLAYGRDEIDVIAVTEEHEVAVEGSRKQKTAEPEESVVTEAQREASTVPDETVASTADVDVSEGSSFWGTCMHVAGILGRGVGKVASVLGRPLMPDDARTDESPGTHFIKRGLLGIDPNGLDETAGVWLRRGFVAAGIGFCAAGAPLAVGAFWSAQALGLLNVMYYKG